MPVPSYDHFIDPLLRTLAAQSVPLRAAECYALVADVVGLTDEARGALLPSGRQPVYKNRIGWAHDRLKRAGYSRSPTRGAWEITRSGRELAEKSGHLSPEEVGRLANVAANSIVSSDKTASTTDDVCSPDEAIYRAREEIEASVRRDLLELIAAGTPLFFEQLVLDVLHRMGYGNSREDLHRTGGSGDGGIDGVISLDRLGFEKVYVQAKRWKNTVGSPEVQTFIGALQLQGATKGVLLTSGPVSRPAREAAMQARGHVVIVDGERLAELMIEYGVGTSHEDIRVSRVDGDYFEAG